ncbi:hypothetical protein B0H14DRAFT_3718550 [Mycena olivaceomarginata]|nr:hypothetical protein B0H14DRAFT_3718550 [Mycena olivaceomarginata]
MLRVAESQAEEQVTSDYDLSGKKTSIVNRYFQCIALVKQLWISHLNDLERRSLIELPPSLKLSDLSTAELINLVKRGITGTTVAPPSDFPRELVIALAGANNSPRRVKLIKGGRHGCGRAEASWSRSIGHNLSVDYFEAKPAANGRIICAAIVRNGGTGSNVEIYEIEPRTRTCTQHIMLRILLHLCMWDPTIWGGLVMIPLRASMNVALLIDWRARTYVILAMGRKPREMEEGKVQTTITSFFK